MLEKLKSFVRDETIFTVSLVVLVAIVSFGLGRHSVVSDKGKVSAAAKPAGVIFTDTPQIIAGTGTTTVFSLQKVVASRTGTKYHLANCPGAAQIKEENKVFFDSVELAKAAGYAPAANCPGLLEVGTKTADF